MAILETRPHSLYRLQRISETTYDDKGNPYPDRHEWTTEPTPCNAVPSTTGASEITTPDGKTHRYALTIYLDTTAPDLSHGDRIRVKLSDSKSVEGEIKGYIRYQHYCKAWL